MNKLLVCLLSFSQALGFCDVAKPEKIDVQKFQKSKKFVVSKNDLTLPKDKVKKTAIRIENEKEEKQRKKRQEFLDEAEAAKQNKNSFEDYRVAKDLSVRPTKKNKKGNEIKDEKS